MAQVLLTAANVQLSSVAKRKPENFRLPGRPNFFLSIIPDDICTQGAEEFRVNI